MILELRNAEGTARFSIESVGWDDESLLGVHVTAETRWFTVDFSEQLVIGETDAWAEGLRKLHRDMAGAYVFRPFLRWLEITYAMGKKGELHVSIQLQTAPDYLDEVRLFLNLDQSYLPAMADQISEFGNP